MFPRHRLHQRSGLSAYEHDNGRTVCPVLNGCQPSHGATSAHTRNVYSDKHQEFGNHKAYSINDCYVTTHRQPPIAARRAPLTTAHDRHPAGLFVSPRSAGGGQGPRHLPASPLWAVRVHRRAVERSAPARAGRFPRPVSGPPCRLAGGMARPAAGRFLQAPFSSGSVTPSLPRCRSMGSNRACAARKGQCRRRIKPGRSVTAMRRNTGNHPSVRA